MTPKLDAGNIRATANTLSTLNTNGDLTFALNGTGSIIFSNLTATTVPYLDGSKKLTSSAVTPTELGYLSGVSSAIQTQINLKAPIASPTFTGTVTGTFSGNLTGNVSGNATTVTTNANLTGPITSSGNATSVGAQTGTGSTFVMDTSPILVTPNLGTPSALVGTNISGTGASFTAGHVTTNANLTGPITSSGNATTVAAQTGTGSIFVMQASPTLTTPAINGANFNFGTASNTNRLVLPTDTTTNLAGYTNTAGLLGYDSTQNKVVYNNGTLWTAVGSGSGSGTYQNFLTNPGFEDGTTGWTASGGTFTTASSGANFQGIGSLSGTWDSSGAGQTLTGTAYTIGNGLAGTNALMRCKVMTPSGTSTHTLGTWDGSTLANTITVPSSTTAQYVEIAFPFGAAATTIAPRFTSVNANEPLLSIDDCYVGTNFQISTQSPITDWVAYTPTGAWVTNTTYSGFWRRVGGDMEVMATIVLAGAPNAATIPTVLLPTGYTIDATKVNGGSLISNRIPFGYWSSGNGTNFEVGTVQSTGASTSVELMYQSAITGASMNGVINTTTPFTWASGYTVNVYFKVPIATWTSQTAVRADNSDYDSTAYTPTITGFGTVSAVTAFHRRVGDKLIGWGQFTSGTNTAVLSKISIPSGKVMDTTKSAGSQIVGKFNVNATPFSGALTFFTGTSTTEVLLSSDTQAYTNGINGSSWANGSIFSFYYEVPIVGWTNNQRVPLLVGSVTSSTTSLERIERARLETSCTTATCTLADNTPAISSVTRASTGNYTINYVAGSFTVAPTCQIMTKSTTAVKIATNVTSTTSSTTFQVYTVGATPALADDGWNITCTGQR